MSDVSVTFGAKDENLAKTFKSVGDQTKSLGESFKSMLVPLAAIGAAFMGLRKMASDFQAAIDMGGRLNDLSARTGETAGKLMILERAFDNAGAGADAVGPVLNKLQKFMVEASEGGSAQAAAMAKLGLSYDLLKSQTPTEQLQAVAAKISGLSDPAERSTLAMQILGRSGGELIPLFRAMGVELETAKAQLGSAPGIMDRTNQALDTIGDNMNAVRKKSTEFALGLISDLAPAIAAVTERLANIDAAGIGAKFSEYAKKTLDWAVETFKLSGALTNIETAISGIMAGDIGGGLKLMFLQARDTALNAINEIFAGSQAAVQTLSGILAKLFDSSGALYFTAVTLIEMLGAKLSSVFASSVAGIVRAMGPAFNNIADGIEYQAETAERTFGMLAKGIGAQFELVGEQVKEAISDAPKEFAANYEANIKTPLFEMESKMAETAEHAAKVQANLEGAAKAMTQISDAAPTLDSPAPRVPSAADIGNSIATAGRGGAGGGGSATQERQLSARERQLISPNESRAARMEARGLFDAAERERALGQSRLEESRMREATREIQGRFGLPTGATMTPEEIVKAEGKTSPFDPKALKKRAKEIEDAIKERAGQGDGTKALGKGGADGKGGTKESPLERLVSEIKELVAKIEPKLPTAAMGV
jgi:hypothetical protein